MTKIEKLKAALSDVKRMLFEEVPAPPVPPVPAYALADGTPIEIDKLEVGGLVTIAGIPAPAGDHTLASGEVVSTDANGIITKVMEVESPEPPEAPEMPEDMKKKMPDFGKPKEVQKYLEQFAASPIPGDVMGKMLTVLFEDRFGYQIQQAKAEEAINAWKETFATQKAEIEKLKGVNKQLFALVEQLAELPVGEPVPAKGKDNFRADEPIVGIREDIRALASLI
jgi:hypothetical protein